MIVASPWPTPTQRVAKPYLTGLPFFARTVVGPRMPSLVYMLVHENMAGREKSWDGFRTSPDWKRVAATPGYADAEIVSNITTVFLRPAAYSQI